MEIGAQAQEPMANQAIGKTSATDREPTSSDKFTFWLAPEVIVNPFDIVEVEQVSHEGKSRTYGLVTILKHATDSPSHLANFISSNFGELSEEPNTPRQGTTIAHVNVLSNDKDIYMPVASEKLVRFANEKGIQIALGIDEMEPKDRIPAGLIKMSNGTAAVAYIDRRYVLGPESAHVNITGISGLATKTSYAIFLIQSILQRLPEEEKDKVAVVILNVKHGDLLQIDRRPEKPLPAEEMEKWEALGLKPEPFPSAKVHYFLPRGHETPRTGRPNSFIVPDFPQIYAYDLDGTIDKLDFLFTEVSDPSGAMEALIGDIMHGIIGGEADFKNVASWENLLNGPPLVDGTTHQIKQWREHYKSTVGKFRRHLRRLVRTMNSGIFVDARARDEKALADEIRKIQGGHVYVVDIARLYEHEQMLVFGDLLKTVYSLKAEPPEDRKEPVPEKIIFFVDELNKYAPSGARVSTLTQQVLDIAERGRSLGVILISAQQFMSAVHDRVTGNCATKVIGRSGSAEIMQPDYRFLDDEIKANVTRLSKGELLLVHAVYRQPVKIIFPRPAYKQQEF
jgi:hypothetical protein